jgi:hypothetical protein
MTRIGLGTTALALTFSLLGFGTGVAMADPPRVVVEAPFFIPEADFRHEDGYYRTNDGRYYHYDRERSGWHYGRNHAEGVRFEHRHHRR